MFVNDQMVVHVSLWLIVKVAETCVYKFSSQGSRCCAVVFFLPNAKSPARYVLSKGQSFAGRVVTSRKRHLDVVVDGN